MDLDRLRSLLAVPLACLFLILVLCVFAVQKQPSVGMHLPLPKVRVHPDKDCDFLSDRNIVLQLHKDGSIFINETRVSQEELRSILVEIYETREERVIYILPDSDISFGEFSDIYDKVASSINGLHIALSTRLLDRELKQCPEGSSCGLDWPDHMYVPCVWSNIRPVHVLHSALR